MQLIKTTKSNTRTSNVLKQSLRTAAFGLLGYHGAAQAADEKPTAQTPEPTTVSTSDWQVDAAVLYYSEADRVTAVEGVTQATLKKSDLSFYALKFVIDSLTGATPSGALASSQVQTFTRPSGSAQYTNSAGNIPLDDSFKDTRFALSGIWSQPFASVYTSTLGAGASKEYDYFSSNVNFTLGRDFNDKNTNVFGALALSFDSIMPVGGAPIAFSTMKPPGTTQSKNGDESKAIIDLLFGITQVFGKHTLGQLNYSYGNHSGYLNDPYKILTSINPDTLIYDNYLYENRPDKRTTHSIFTKLKHQFGYGDIADISYRYLWDDWGIQSHTIDVHYRWKPFVSHYIEPHVRFYHQDQADFYRQYINNQQALPEYASADYRLATFDGLTYGLKYGYHINDMQEISLRAEYYTQTGDQTTDLQNFQYDVFPDLKAYMVQLGYKIKF